MPSLTDSLRTPQQIEEMGYTPVDLSQKNSLAAPSVNLQPGLNAYLRCPLPPIWSTTTDTLRQFYQGNQVPQIRLFNPSPIYSSQGSGTVTNITNVTGSTSTGGSTTSTSLAITNTSVKTPSIIAGGKFTGSFTLSKAFELLSISATSPCRIQMYGTMAAQSADASRGLDISPPAGTGQNIICDVVLDTAPYTWNFQNREGANGDNPVSSTIYLTVTNLDAITDIITMAISYIPIVS